MVTDPWGEPLDGALGQLVAGGVGRLCERSAGLTHRSGVGWVGRWLRATGSAPGRLDLLGGVADYSGALVLEMPTRQSIEVTGGTDERLVVGPAAFRRARSSAWPDWTCGRAAGLSKLPRWTHYLIGVAVVLMRNGVIGLPAARIDISSDLPAAVGVASSAALEGAHGAGPRRMEHRSAAAGRVVPGGGEPCGGRAVWHHGPGGGGSRISRRRAADSLPARRHPDRS